MFKAIADFFKFYFVTPKPETNKEPKIDQPVLEPKQAKTTKKPSTKPRTSRKPNGTTKSKTKKQ